MLTLIIVRYRTLQGLCNTTSAKTQTFCHTRSLAISRSPTRLPHMLIKNFSLLFSGCSGFSFLTRCLSSSGTLVLPYHVPQHHSDHLAVANPGQRSCGTKLRGDVEVNYLLNSGVPFGSKGGLCLSHQKASIHASLRLREFHFAPVLLLQRMLVVSF